MRGGVVRSVPSPRTRRRFGRTTPAGRILATVAAVRPWRSSREGGGTLSTERSESRAMRCPIDNSLLRFDAGHYGTAPVKCDLLGHVWPSPAEVRRP